MGINKTIIESKRKLSVTLSDDKEVTDSYVSDEDCGNIIKMTEVSQLPLNKDINAYHKSIAKSKSGKR